MLPESSIRIFILNVASKQNMINEETQRINFSKPAKNWENRIHGYAKNKPISSVNKSNLQNSIGIIVSIYFQANIIIILYKKLKNIMIIYF